MAQRYALIIGISNYHRSVGNLTKPTTDAQAVAHCLRHHGGFEVTLLTETLTLEALRQALKQFLLEQANNNDALIYFTGHGILLESTTGYRETFLATSDTEIIRQAGKPMEPLYILPFGELNSLIQQSNLSSLVLLLDCCHSGDMLERDPMERALTAFNSTQRNYYFITACRSFEESRAKRSDQHSLFTGALLEALAAPTRPDDESLITSGLLFYRLSQSLKGSGQEALHLGWGNDIAIATYPAIKSAATTPELNLHNPYIGLASFDSATAQYFYGREQAVRALQARLLNCRVLTVFGPSGCGKSSLIKAGLLPAIQHDPVFGGGTWDTKVITPTAQPLTVLRDLLNQPPKPFVLFIDQFEELFTLCEDEAQQREFIHLIGESVSRMDHLKRLIIAIRGDFLDRCAKIPESAALINRENELTTYMVTHLSSSEMAAAIECPARQHEVTFQAGLVPLMIADVGNEPGALPLLQYALTKLWEVCIKPDAAVLTEAGYTQIGGVQGALQQRADQLYRNLHPDDQAFVRQLFMELVQLGEGQEVTRRKASWEKLRETRSPAQLSRIIEQLTHERLIVTDEKTVEVAHEALLSQWTLLKNWIEEDRETIRLSRRLESDCHEWRQKNQSEDFLLSTGRLAAIQEWVAKEQPRLTHLETEFLNQSIEKRDRELQAQVTQERRLREEAEGRAIAEIGEKIEAERREKEALGRVKAEKRGKRFAIAAGILTALTLSSGAFVQIQQQQIGSEKTYAIRSLIEKAQQRLASHDELEAMIISVEALAKIKEANGVAETEIQKIRAVLSQVREIDRIQAHQGKITSLAISSDGKLIVTGGIDKKIRIWDVEKDNLTPLIPAHDNLIRGMRFSSNNQLFASTSVDKTVKVWSRQGNLVHQFNYGDYAFDVDFSSDGKEIAASGNNRGIVIWNLKKSTITRTIQEKKLEPGKSFRIYKLDFHPIIKTFLISTGNKGYDLILFDLSQENSKPKYIGKSILETGTVRFDHDGKMIALHDELNNISIRNINGDLLAKIRDSGDSLRYVEFSFDGKKLASLDRGGNVKIWSIDEALLKWKSHQEIADKSIEMLQVGDGSISQVAFMVNSKFLSSRNSGEVMVSGDTSGFIRVWAVSQNKRIYDNKNVENMLTQSCNQLEKYIRREEKTRSNILTICKK
ncbi:caspase family protein [Leptolyngbyaceae cyanobacterium UHCC 1019]